jgi:hypothetical protein
VKKPRMGLSKTFNSKAATPHGPNPRVLDFIKNTPKAAVKRAKI